MAVTANVLHWIDYVIIISGCVLSLCIGFYFSVSGGRQKTINEYLLGERKLGAVPVSLSLLVSFINALMIIGVGAEVFRKGISTFFSSVTVFIAISLTSLFFIPLFYPLKITSCFEYMDMRFKSKLVRVAGSLLMQLNLIVFTGFVIFAPAIALEAVTPIPLWASILMMGGIGTLYTTLGGIKAVVWTDVFQSLVLVGGMIAVIIQGIISAGGWTKVWDYAVDGDRFRPPSTNIDFTTRHTYLNMLFGETIFWFERYALSQAAIQRYIATKSQKTAIVAALFNIPGVILLLSLSCGCGIVAYGYYRSISCDPITEELIASGNQIIPFFVVDALGKIVHGLPGLFISCLAAGALSTISSTLNAAAALMLTDIIVPFIGYLRKRSTSYDCQTSEASEIEEWKKTLIAKLLVMIFGVVCVALAFFVTVLPGPIIQVTGTCLSALGGVETGMFLLATLFPWANYLGTVFGALLSFGLTLWLSIKGFEQSHASSDLPPIPNSSCTGVPYFNETVLQQTTTLEPDFNENTHLFFLYQISYQWLLLIAVLGVIIFGLIISFLTGYTKASDTDWDLILTRRLFGHKHSKDKPKPPHKDSESENSDNSSVQLTRINLKTL